MTSSPLLIQLPVRDVFCLFNFAPIHAKAGELATGEPAVQISLFLILSRSLFLSLPPSLHLCFLSFFLLSSLSLPAFLPFLYFWIIYLEELMAAGSSV